MRLHSTNCDIVIVIIVALSDAVPLLAWSMKIAKACCECRLAKRKCLADEHHGAACNQCKRRNLSCSAVRKAQLRDTRPPVLLPGETLSSPHFDLDVETRVALVRLYLRLVHDKPHTLFHPPTLLRQVEHDSLAPMVLYGLIGMAAR